MLAFSGTTAFSATSPVDIQIKAGAFGVGTPTTAEFRHLIACP